MICMPIRHGIWMNLESFTLSASTGLKRVILWSHLRFEAIVRHHPSGGYWRIVYESSASAAITPPRIVKMLPCQPLSLPRQVLVQLKHGCCDAADCCAYFMNLRKSTGSSPQNCNQRTCSSFRFALDFLERSSWAPPSFQWYKHQKK